MIKDNNDINNDNEIIKNIPETNINEVDKGI